MLKREVFPYYEKCVRELTIQYEFLKSLFTEDYVDELCKIRGYVSDSQHNLIEHLELGYCSISDVDSLGEFASEIGLVSKNGNFLLNNRYIIPVYDISNNLIALIGYLNDEKKYITTPSPFFSKELLFFNFRHAYDLSWRDFNGVVFLVEGVFDCLSLRSIGLPAIATMGSDVSELKCEFLKFFKKVVAIPDDDKVGRRALNKFGYKGWKLPHTATIVKFKGGTLDMGERELHCKDIDNFVSWYEESDVIEILLSLSKSTEEVEELIL